MVAVWASGWLEFALGQRHTWGMEFKDYYAILGVAPDADAAAIKQAYRRLARKYHPDVSKEPDAEAQFKALGEAYEVLKDPSKRQSYDQLRQSGWRGGDDFQPPPGWQQGGRGGFQGGFQDGFGGGDFSGFSDFFESLFGGGGRRGPMRAAGRDHEASLEIDLETAYAGGRQRINLTRDGRAQSLQVSIPAGVTDGSRIRLAGQGEPGRGGGPAGDLHLKIGIRPHRWFVLDGRNVSLNLPITPSEAALGTKVSVPTLAGSVQLQVPAGSGSGRKLRLKGRGLPGRGSQAAGDQLVVVQIVVPATLTEAERQAYAQLAKDSDFDPRAHFNA